MLSDAGVVCGLPKLGKQVFDVCGPCQHCKQLKTTHKVVQHTSTFKVIKLFHMDLMGPMQVESIAGKRYFLCVLMISLGLLGYLLLERNQTHLIPLKICV